MESDLSVDLPSRNAHSGGVSITSLLVRLLTREILRRVLRPIHAQRPANIGSFVRRARRSRRKMQNVIHRFCKCAGSSVRVASPHLPNFGQFSIPNRRVVGIPDQNGEAEKLNLQMAYHQTPSDSEETRSNYAPFTHFSGSMNKQAGVVPSDGKDGVHRVTCSGVQDAWS